MNENQQHFLGAPQSEGGNEDFAPVGHHFGHRLGQARLFGLAVGVQAIAIGGFGDDHMGADFGHHKRVYRALRIDRVVAGEKDAAFGRVERERAGAQHVTRQQEGHLHLTLTQREQLAQRHHFDASQHGQNGVLRVEGNFRLLEPARLHNAQRVGRHDFHQSQRGLGGIERGLRVGQVDEGQRADVVGVSVSDQNGVDRPEFLNASQVRQATGMSPPPMRWPQSTSRRRAPTSTTEQDPPTS